jgi:hypothetical protein
MGTPNHDIGLDEVLSNALIYSTVPDALVEALDSVGAELVSWNIEETLKRS